jgi:hypothetical protein
MLLLPTVAYGNIASFAQALAARRAIQPEGTGMCVTVNKNRPLGDGPQRGAPRCLWLPLRRSGVCKAY